MIIGVKSEKVLDVWPKVSHWVDQAMERTLETNEGILEALQSKDMQLYIVLEDEKIVACFITAIVNYDKAKSCVVVALGGEGLKMWLDQVEDTICQFAKSEKCRYVEMNGRRGWLKELSKYGWKENSIEMTKEVSL